MSKSITDTIFSPCCDAFIIYIGNSLVCSECSNIIKNIEDDEEITIGMEYNVINDTTNTENISSDIINSQLKKLSRCSNDITYMLIDKKCPKCGAISRFGRNLNSNKVYICTKCRNVFSD